MKRKTARDEPHDWESGPNIARKLDVDPATVRRYAREGMPHHVIGEGFVRYRFSEVLEWLARRPRKTKKDVITKSENQLPSARQGQQNHAKQH